MLQNAANLLEILWIFRKLIWFKLFQISINNLLVANSRTNITFFLLLKSAITRSCHFIDWPNFFKWNQPMEKYIRTRLSRILKENLFPFIPEITFHYGTVEELQNTSHRIARAGKHTSFPLLIRTMCYLFPNLRRARNFVGDKVFQGEKRFNFINFQDNRSPDDKQTVCVPAMLLLRCCVVIGEELHIAKKRTSSFLKRSHLNLNGQSKR